MAKVTLTDLANLQNESTAVVAINANNAALETAMENTLSRDGTSPNTLSANLDMNSYRILNLPTPIDDADPVRLGDVISEAASTALGASIIAAATVSSINSQTGTTYTLLSTDSLKIVSISNASAITVTLPSTLSAGFNCIVGQEGAGQITFAAGSGATVHSPGDALKTALRYSFVNAFVLTNTNGTSAAWRLGGDLTP